MAVLQHKDKRVDIRNATGMHLSRAVRGWYWISWLALLVALYTAILLELMLRVPDTIGWYPIEAALVLGGPLLCLYLADRLTINHYLHIWHLLRDRAHAQLLLEPGHVDRVRAELRFNPLLRWLRPPRAGELGSQLFAAALWWQAVTAPEGTQWLRRYGEPLAMALGLLAGVLVPLLCALAAVVLEVLPARPALILAMGCGALGLATLAVSLLRTTARWQAIADYFAAFRSN